MYDFRQVMVYLPMEVSSCICMVIIVGADIVKHGSRRSVARFDSAQALDVIQAF